MPTIPPSITALPSAPDPNNRTTFNALAYPWSAALPTFGTQVSAVGANVKANADEAHADSVATAADRVQTGLDKVATAADRVQTAADRVQTGLDRASATSSAGTATTKASEASASAIAAASSAASISGGPVTSVNSKTGVVSLVKADIGLGSVDNTNDSSKPISTATQTALNGKQPNLVSSTNIKTVNGASLLGAGDLVIGSGALVLLSSVTASSSATVDIETTFNSTYDEYVLKVTGMQLATDSVDIYARMKIGGSYLSSSTYRSSSDSGTLLTEIRFFAGFRNDRPFSLEINIHNPSSTSIIKSIDYYGVARATSEANVISGGGWNTDTGNAMTGLRLFASSGNITSGTFRLYGIKKT